MSRKLHLICMKTDTNTRCNLHDISYFSETQNYNYVFFRYSFSLVFNIFLKITFPLYNVSHL